MMKFVLTTRVESPYRDILPLLTKKVLFETASFFMGAKLAKFEGHQVGNEFELEFGGMFFKQKWSGVITDYFEDDFQVYFIDEGKVLPFFLRTWKHKHVFQKASEKAAFIIDDVEFHSGALPGDLVLFPLIYSHFLFRKAAYKIIFNGVFPLMKGFKKAET